MPSYPGQTADFRCGQFAVEVDARLTVAAGHLIGHQVKDKLVAAFPCLRDALVHLEPYPNGHRQTDPLPPPTLNKPGDL
ncbi:MAG: cation transporter dimerization domain-containing protein [Pirellulaceae bacterium]